MPDINSENFKFSFLVITKYVYNPIKPIVMPAAIIYAPQNAINSEIETRSR